MLKLQFIRKVLMQNKGCCFITQCTQPLPAPWDAHHPHAPHQRSAQPQNVPGQKIPGSCGLIRCYAQQGMGTQWHRHQFCCLQSHSCLPALPKPVRVTGRKGDSFSTLALPGGRVTEREQVEVEEERHQSESRAEHSKRDNRK